ncbi:hypothetical protein A0257_22400 (plasmid) [Hymenobacter psoromatis]|nr:hypothetical protein A0257_22400 [Hymenobacter psoromatis]
MENYLTDPTTLPALLRQAATDLADPAVTYVLAGHYYVRTNHPRYRHFPAVFALQQDEVSRLEVRVDFVAFDTELIRYPEDDQAPYPGPWTDRFRATVPFAQLYQLCRQVLTPAEQAAEAISYGPETIIYYSAGVHQNYPTLADMNQAYAAPLPSVHPLVAVLTAIATGLADPANHYLVNTTHFDGPSGPVLLGMLHLNAHTVRDLAIEADAFTCSVLLTPHDRQWSLVRAGFAHVWQVVRNDSPQVDLAVAGETGGILYDAPEVLSTYARAGRPA